MSVSAESFATDVTDVSFLSGVLSQVSLQVSSAQTLVTDDAAHVLSVLVSEDVCDQLLSLCERLGAEGAAERSVGAARVELFAAAQVALEMQRAHEALSTALTDDDGGQVTLRAPGGVLQQSLVHNTSCDVCAQVQPQGVAASEASVTHAAHKGLDAVVEHHVSPHVPLLPEASAAD